MDERMAKDMTTGPVLKLLILFALPLALGNALQAVYSMVDMAVVGRFVGPAGLSAVGIGGQIQGVYLCIGMGFSAGAQIMISQQIGAQDKDLNSTIGTLFTMEILLGIVVGVLGIVFCNGTLELMNTPVEAWNDARSYVIICCIGLIFIFIYNAVCGVLRGMGDSKLPMIFIAIASVINLILDVLFVGGFKLGVAGAALATVIAQGLSCLISLVYLFRNREKFGFDFRLSSFRIAGKRLKPMTKLGVPYILQWILITASMMYVNARINDYGVVASAVDGVGNRLFSLFNIVAGAISTASGTMIGQCFGARKMDRIRSSYRACTLICLLSWCVIAVFLLFTPRLVFSLFTSDSAVLEMAPAYLKVTALNVLGVCAMNGPLSVIDGVGNAGLGLVIAILDGVVARIGLTILFGAFWGLPGFWLGNAAAGFVSVFLAGAYYYSGKWRTRDTVI